MQRWFRFIITFHALQEALHSKSVLNQYWLYFIALLNMCINHSMRSLLQEMHRILDATSWEEIYKTNASDHTVKRCPWLSYTGFFYLMQWSRATLNKLPSPRKCETMYHWQWSFSIYQGVTSLFWSFSLSLSESLRTAGKKFNLCTCFVLLVT